MGAPGNPNPNGLESERGCWGLKPVMQKWHEHTSKGAAQDIPEVSAKKHGWEGMSGQEGARRQPLMGSENTEQGKPVQSQNEKVLWEPNFSWSNWRKEMPEPILREKQAPD